MAVEFINNILLISESFKGVHSLLHEAEIDCPTHFLHGRKVRRETHTYGKKKQEMFYYLHGNEKKSFTSIVELIEYYKLNDVSIIDDDIQRYRIEKNISNSKVKIIPLPPFGTLE